MQTTKSLKNIPASILKGAVANLLHDNDYKKRFMR